MALTDFTDNNDSYTYYVKKKVANEKVCGTKKGDSFTIRLANDASGIKVVDKFDYASKVPANIATWKNATDLAYDKHHDFITGMIEIAAPEATTQRVKRPFCISLDRDPDRKKRRIHIYVGKRVTGGSPHPDDGSWTGDGN